MIIGIFYYNSFVLFMSFTAFSSVILSFRFKNNIMRPLSQLNFFLIFYSGPHFAAVNNNNEIIVTDFHNHSVKVSGERILKGCKRLCFLNGDSYFFHDSALVV